MCARDSQSSLSFITIVWLLHKQANKQEIRMDMNLHKNLDEILTINNLNYTVTFKN